MSFQADKAFEEFRKLFIEDTKFSFKDPSFRSSLGKNLYMSKPKQLEEATKPNL